MPPLRASGERLSSVILPSIVGSDGTRRCMMRRRSTVIGFGVAGFNTFASRRLSKLRCGFGSRASAANLTASTSSTIRHRFENLKMFTRRVPGSISIRPR